MPPQRRFCNLSFVSAQHPRKEGAARYPASPAAGFEEARQAGISYEVYTGWLQALKDIKADTTPNGGYVPYSKDKKIIQLAISLGLTPEQTQLLLKQQGIGV